MDGALTAMNKLTRRLPHLHHLIQLLGGIQAIRDAGHIKLENSPYMPLTLEVTGEGLMRSAGYTTDCAIAVSHTHIQNGDLMRDPEVVFDYYERGGLFIPTTFTQHTLGTDRQIIWRDEAGQLRYNPGEHRNLCSFCNTWQQNLRDQGWLDIAKLRARQGSSWISHTSQS